MLILITRSLLTAKSLTHGPYSTCQQGTKGIPLPGVAFLSLRNKRLYQRRKHQPTQFYHILPAALADCCLSAHSASLCNFRGVSPRADP